MAHQGTIEVVGTVVENLPNTLFRVRLEDGKIILCHLSGKMRIHYIKIMPGDSVKLDDGREILCHLSGKMRIHYIKIMPGDAVKLEMTPYDPGKGRITYRMK